MLAADIVTRIREYLAAELGPRDRELTSALVAEERAAAASGNLGNSRTAFRFTDAGRNELAARSTILWEIIRRTYLSMSSTFRDGVLEDLRQQINEHMAAQTRRVVEICLQRPAANGLTKEQFREIIQRELDACGREHAAKLDIEAQFYVDDLRRIAAAQPAGTVLNFNAPVGAVQTAPLATANVSLAGTEGGRLIGTLQALQQAIERSVDTTPEQRAESTEIVIDTIAAVKSEKPNAGKVSGLLGGLATTIQTTASLQPAYQAVKTAAAIVGISLP